MRTEIKNELTYHYSDCGKWCVEQESKHYFYLNEISGNKQKAIGQVHIKDKDFRFFEVWFTVPGLIAINTFLTQVFEYHKH